MNHYQQLHWESLNLLKNHMYRYLATPLSHALGRLALIEETDPPAEHRNWLTHAEWDLERAASLLQAWAALIHVESGGMLPVSALTEILPDGLPRWLVANLEAQTEFRATFTQPILVHAASFYQSLLLMAQLGALAGTLRHLIIADDPEKADSVLMRAIFEPPEGGPYRSLGGFLSHWGDGPVGEEIAFQVQALGGFLKISRGRFALQDNPRAGQQAFTASFRASTGQPLAALLERELWLPESAEKDYAPEADAADAGQESFDLPEDVFGITPPDDVSFSTPGQEPAVPRDDEDDADDSGPPQPVDPDLEPR